MMMRRITASCLLLGLFFTIDMLPSSSQAEELMTLTLHSTAFDHNGAISGKYTCEGGDLSPPLAWEGVP